MDSQSSERPSLPARDLINGAGDDATVYNRGSAVRHLAILGSFLIPIAFLPYMITRRQVTTLRRRVDEMGAITAFLKQRFLAPIAPAGEAGAPALLTQMRQELEVMRDQASQRATTQSDLTMDIININEELDQMRNAISSAQATQSALPDNHISREELETVEHGLHKLRREAESSSADIQDQIRLIRGEQEALRSEFFKISDQLQSAKTGPHAVDSTELHRLLQEAQQTRAIFGAIGSSLGDVATIIQRVEIEMGHERTTGGYDPLERLRVLAMQMQMQDETIRPEKRGRTRG
ncbi:hypothetical protein C8R44DRAFT_820602 [Mycena epipterygia]|nr:hypothetical protein C8R44DRAFT_820602 [Mycena epipterygia]